MAVLTGKQPLYSQLANTLREHIENDLEPDDLIPSERDLSERYGLSRTTVRLALKELERIGLIYRQHGRGTFVADQSGRVTDLAGGYSFSDQQRDLGRKPKTVILEFEVVEANKFLAQHMHLTLGDKVFRIKRLRLADNVPMMIENTFIPVSQFLSFTREKLEENSLYHIMETEYNVVISYAEEEFKASIAKQSDAEQLGIPEGAPVLNLERTTYSDQNVIVEFTLSVARADQFHYKITHVRS